MSLLEPRAHDRPARFFASEPKVELIRELKRAGYQFVTPSVSTHRRVLRRPEMTEARHLRDVFGWSLPFVSSLLSPRLLDTLARGNLLRSCDGKLRSTVRVSSLGEDLLLHSAFPTTASDAVFFGPDTYRFASFLREELKGAPSQGVVVDIGTGSGAGAISAARCGAPSRLVLTDVNARALDLAKANLRAAGLAGDLIHTNGLAGFTGQADLIVANPPFIAGAGGHTYRDGGDLHGARLSLEWAIAAVAKLAPGGRLLLYTGSAIVNGEDRFLRTLKDHLHGEDVTFAYRELDPDIFGGLLGSTAYADAERIAAVGLSITRR